MSGPVYPSTLRYSWARSSRAKTEKPGASVGQAAGVPGPVDGAHSAKAGSILAPGSIADDERAFKCLDFVLGSLGIDKMPPVRESMAYLKARLSALTGGRG